MSWLIEFLLARFVSEQNTHYCGLLKVILSVLDTESGQQVSFLHPVVCGGMRPSDMLLCVTFCGSCAIYLCPVDVAQLRVGVYTRQNSD